MAGNIQCLHCGVVLNLPDRAIGRRMKCPKCGGRFVVGNSGAEAVPAGDETGSKKGPDTTFELTRKTSSVELPVMPTAAGDLRETFDLDLMTGAAAPPAQPARGGGPDAADALALFSDKPAKPRRKTGAEARSSSRRCPTCGGLVPVGMSLCQTCGLDLESGTRIDLMDDLAPPPAARDQGLPLPITILGSLCCALSVILAVAALLVWSKGFAGIQYFIPLAAFGGYASVQFLRGKSVKLLLVALTLGALIDVAALIALPIWQANEEVPVSQRKEHIDDPDTAVEIIKSPSERLDTQRITVGVSLLLLYAATSIVLLSPPVQRHFKK